MSKREGSLFAVVCVLGSLAIAPLHAQQVETKELTIETVRKILAQPQSIPTIGSIPLAGFQFSREVEIGGGRRVIAISCSRNGGLIAFDSEGKVIASVRTGEIISLAIFDLGEDGNSEVILNEVEGSGTGVLLESFAVYRVLPSEIRQIWKGESLSRSAPWKPAGKSPSARKCVFCGLTRAARVNQPR